MRDNLCWRCGFLARIRCRNFYMSIKRRPFQDGDSISARKTPSCQINFNLIFCSRCHTYIRFTHPKVIIWVPYVHPVYLYEAVFQFPDLFSFALWLPRWDSTPCSNSAMICPQTSTGKRLAVQSTPRSPCLAQHRDPSNCFSTKQSTAKSQFCPITRNNVSLQSCNIARLRVWWSGASYKHPPQGPTYQKYIKLLLFSRILLQWSHKFYIYVNMSLFL